MGRAAMTLPTLEPITKNQSWIGVGGHDPATLRVHQMEPY